MARGILPSSEGTQEWLEKYSKKKPKGRRLPAKAAPTTGTPGGIKGGRTVQPKRTTATPGQAVTRPPSQVKRTRPAKRAAPARRTVTPSRPAPRPRGLRRRTASARGRARTRRTR